jgi:RNA polymerase sigma-70 factor (ECF subfamily)
VREVQPADIAGSLAPALEEVHPSPTAAAYIRMEMLGNLPISRESTRLAARQERFSALVDENGTRMLRLAVLVTRDRVLAEDVCQEAFARAWRHLDNLEDDAVGWLSRVTVNEAISACRRRGRFSSLLQRFGTLTRPEDRADTELRLDLAEALNHLSPPHRAVLVLRYYNDLSVEETARLAGIPVGTAKSRLKAALREMRRLTGEETR